MVFKLLAAFLLAQAALASEIMPCQGVDVVKVSLTVDRDMNEAQRRLAKQGAFLVQCVFNQLDFRNRVVNYKWRSRSGRTVDRFWLSGQWSNLAVYNGLVSGYEDLSPEMDRELDIMIDLYSDDGSDVIGYTYPNSRWIWGNWSFWRSYTAANVAGNMAHEYCHKQGWDHEFKWTFEREHSVPYAIGYIVEEMAQELLTRFQVSGWPESYREMVVKFSEAGE